MSEVTKRLPWVGEPDTDAFEHTGLRCLMRRSDRGAWCGYVAIPSGHPAHGLPGYASTFDIDDVLSGEADRVAPTQERMNAVEVHGGITWYGAQEPHGKPDGLWWFGFDCDHAGDVSPKYADRMGLPTGWGTVHEYRTHEYAKAETMRLAEQLAAIAQETGR